MWNVAQAQLDIFWGWLTRADQSACPMIFCLWGSDGGLEDSDISSWNKIVIFPVNQRVPLIKALPQTCKSPDVHVNSTWSEARNDCEEVVLPRWRCRKAKVALLQRSMAISGSISPFNFISFPIQFPVRKVKSGKLWWTVPLKEWQREVGRNDNMIYCAALNLLPEPPLSAVPDGDHFPLYDRRVQLLHATDVSCPLELLWVDEEDRLLHLRKDLIT